MPKRVQKTNTSRYRKGVEKSAIKTAENLFKVRHSIFSSLSTKLEKHHRTFYIPKVPKNEKYFFDKTELKNQHSRSLESGLKKLRIKSPNFKEYENEIHVAFRQLVKKMSPEERAEKLAVLRTLLIKQSGELGRIIEKGIDKETEKTAELISQMTARRIKQLNKRISELEKTESSKRN